MRARSLFENGLETPDDIRKVRLRRIASVRGIGRKLAASIKSEVEGGDPRPVEVADLGGPHQANLGDFS